MMFHKYQKQNKDERSTALVMSESDTEEENNN